MKLSTNKPLFPKVEHVTFEYGAQVQLFQHIAKFDARVMKDLPKTESDTKRGRKGSAEREQDEEPISAMKSKTPVSYTHLTLPTKRIV